MICRADDRRREDMRQPQTLDGGDRPNLAAMRMADRLDPARVFTRIAGNAPDPWQATALRDDSKRKLLHCCRQSGKSETFVAAAVHRAACYPNSEIAVVAHTEVLALDLLRRMRAGFAATPYVATINTAKSEIELDNGSRIVGLSAHADAVRGRTLDVIFCDEAARLDDDVFTSAIPALVAKDGTLWVASTPTGARRGYFRDQVLSDEPGWLRLTIRGSDSGRYTASQLEAQRRALGDLKYSIEFDLNWVTTGGTPAFDPVDLARLFGEAPDVDYAVPRISTGLPDLAALAAAAAAQRKASA
jgi:hypothetical protein